MSYLFPSSTITFDAALRDLAQGSPKARAFAAHALGNVTEPTERRRALDALVQALEDDRPEVRAEACASLGDLAEPGAIPTLVKRLDDGVPAVRQASAIALGSIGHPDGFEPLALALKEGPADLRFQAATSLAEIDPTRSFAPLADALGDPDPQVVAAAALSLGAIGDPRAIPLLIPLLDHPDGGVRFDAAYGLAELRDPSGRGFLIGSLPDQERAWDAVMALTTLGLREDLDALSRALGDRRVPPEATILAAGSAVQLSTKLGTGPNEAAHRVLLAGLAARKTHVRGLAVEQLGLVAGEWAREPLRKLAKSGKGGELLEAIAAALRAIDDRVALAPKQER